MSEKKKEMQLEIQLDEKTAQGSYVNLAVVNHSESEFVLDFMFVQPQAPQAKVNSRIIISPRHAKRLVATLEENLRRYEEAFGALDEELQKPAPAEGNYH